MKIHFFYFFIFISIVCCNTKNNNDILDFYDYSKNQLGNQEIENLYKYGRSNYLFEHYPDSILLKFNRLFNLSGLDDLMIENHFRRKQINIDNIPKEVCLFIDFHGWLTKQDYDSEFYSKVQGKLDALDKANDIKNKKKLSALIEKDKSLLTIGDTLNFIFPIIEENNNRITIHRQYPYSLEISDFEDTLKINGILVDKFEESKRIMLKLKILIISEDVFYFFGEKFNNQDNILIPLQDYGRAIYPMEQM